MNEYLIAVNIEKFQQRSVAIMKNIAVFGGTFNPFHKGHKKLITEVSKAIEFEKIIIIPSKIPPHKSAECLADEQDRIRMIELSIEDNNINCDEICISDAELERNGKSYSYDTLIDMKKLYPDEKYKIHFIMGSDMLIHFSEWYRYREILKMCTLVCLSRCDIDTNELELYKNELLACGGDVIILPVEPLEISSTDIRNAVRQKNYEKLACYLDEKVVKYILERDLYIDGYR